MEITGTLIQKYDTEQVSEKFKKRQLVIKTEETYPQTIPLQLTQDKCGLLDSYNVGDRVKALINLRGREWISTTREIKYFATIEAWKIEKIDGAATAEPIQVNDDDGSGFPF